jgi:hypothetical protein
VKNSNLLKRLSQLGFPLLEVTEEAEANVTLADLVKSRDLRLWEGFSEVLAFSAEMGMFDYNKTKEHLTNDPDKLHFDLLLTMSLALYKALNLKFAWTNKLYQPLDNKGKRRFEVFFEALKNNQDFHLGEYLMSSQRLKTTFNSYFRQERNNLKDLLSVKEELGLEYALSEVFPPKQKELFLKKLRNEKFTKTEREYFSRVVKKKVLALANPELHRLSQKLLE